jgi:hypothetical protein
MPLPPRASNILPDKPKTIGLAAGFELYFDKLPHAAATKAKMIEALEIYQSSAPDGWRSDEKYLGWLSPEDCHSSRWRRWIMAAAVLEAARRMAEKDFRDALAAGQPLARTWNADTDVVSVPACELWNKKMSFGAAGFADNFVHPDDPAQPGPSTEIAGLLRPVFFYEAELNKWLAA